jgi:hypothetical protein
MKELLLFCCAACLFFTSSFGQNKHAATTRYPSYKGLIMAGYQGWFRAQGVPGKNTSVFPVYTSL